eukprot:gnl/TRDRNA2_/TRDRNA2_167032_c0_seq1.p1 gnl/TRDRNA2_/TRDRNA2_167032_c0~~gnl/TRDRNA2_/TRDRNA2_167032_c0_seq1.p1  ORF type:complete len:285 (+),score=23.95 gnl/TRDRNA2_/TRDRNA2_167032_c0_seq1:26-880(+)
MLLLACFIAAGAVVTSQGGISTLPLSRSKLCLGPCVTNPGWKSAPVVGFNPDAGVALLPPYHPFARSALRERSVPQALPFWGALGGVPGGTPPTPLDVCPGAGRPPLGEPFCNIGDTLRVCTQLLDGERNPLTWGDDGNFWDITNQRRFLTSEVQKMRLGEGDSRCVSMWKVAVLVEKVGCENVNIRCGATDIDYVMEKPVPAAFKNCLTQKCESDQRQPDVTLANPPATSLNALGGDATFWTAGDALGLVTVTSAGGAAWALAAMLVVRKWRKSHAPAEPLIA